MNDPITAKQLYAEMDRLVPNWRTNYLSFDAAVVAAGPSVGAMCASWKTAFARKTDSRLVAKDARIAERNRIAQLRHQEEQRDTYRPARKEVDTPVFDHSSAGRSLGAEWTETFTGEFQPGLVHGGWDGDETEAEHHDDQAGRGPAIGRVVDALYHPDRPANAAPWSFPSYVWAPVAPRSYAGSPKCY